MTDRGEWQSPQHGGDWLSDTWERLPDRTADVLARRLGNETLAGIATGYGLTRERVRQLQLVGEEILISSQRRYAPDLPERIATTLARTLAVPDAQVTALLPTRTAAARQVMLWLLGAARPRTWLGELPGWWTADPTSVDLRLRELAAAAPLSTADAGEAATALALPADFPLDDLLSDTRSPLTKHELGWIRRGRPTRDIAFLWLQHEGAPRTVRDIATVTGAAEHATREAMRRDEAFAQVRPEGTWGLTDWRLEGADSRYNSAVEVVVEVLRDQGPLTLQQLRTEATLRYPVSEWRISQCLSSNLIGLTDTGLYDLVERGAEPIEDAEPRRPSNIQTSPAGDLIGIALQVDSDVLRGSGVGVPRWLTWHLGLRTAPSRRHFPFAPGTGDLIVRRATSSSSFSSLRAPVLNLELADGCMIAVLIRTSPDSASLRHTCDPSICPASTEREA